MISLTFENFQLNVDGELFRLRDVIFTGASVVFYKHVLIFQLNQEANVYQNFPDT